MRTFTQQITSGRLKVQARCQEIGQDILISIWGGNRPHIGALGVAVPRPSLRNPKRWSATSSNFTFVGHKEDTLVRKVSERLAARLKKNVVVVAGLHWDDLKAREIRKVEHLTQRLADGILEKITSREKKKKARKAENKAKA